ncbi:MAG: oligosaccharide flippase family protein [Candidatus Thermoplasmatota archaeon]
MDDDALVAEAEPRTAPGIFQNSVSNVIGLVGISALGALVGLLTAITLGRETVGILAVAFGISEFGRALSACTHIPSIVEYHAGKHDERTIYGSSLAVKAIASSGFVLLVMALAPTVDRFLHVPPVILVPYALVVILVTGFEVGAARLEATNRMVRSNLINASGTVLSVFLVTALVVTHTLTLYTSVAVVITWNLALSAVAWHYARPRGALRVDVGLAWSMTRYGLRIVSASLLTQGLLWTDTLLISHIQGNADAGVYQTVFTMTNVMVTASSAMGVALVPALSRLRERGDDTSMGYQRGTVIALCMSLGIALLWIVGGRFVLGLYGPGFVEGYPALVVLTLFGISAALTVPAATMLTIHARAGLLSALSLGQLLLNVPLNYFMILHFGLLGAAVATTMIFALGTALSWIAVRRTTGAWPLSNAAVQEVREYAAKGVSRLRG